MSEVLDRAGLAAGLESAGIAWHELEAAERASYAVDGVEPSAVCWPSTYQEAAQALAVADRLGLAVSTRGSGTKVGLGNPPRGCDLIVSTERLNKIVDYAPANLTVTVEAGIRLAELQSKLAEGGQYLPLDPPNADRATVGGIIAANASGPRRFGLGSARDLVIGTRAATTLGTVVQAGGRVVKNVAGYDLNKLYIGSLGTLVVVAEISFKVAPRPAGQTTVVGRFGRFEDLGKAVQTILRSPLLPTAVDLLNADAAARLGLSWLPEPRGGYLLATLGTAPGRALVRQRDELRRIYQAAGAADLVDVGDDESEGFWSAVAERPSRVSGASGVRAKLSVPAARLAEAVRACEAQPLPVGGLPAIGGRAGSGVIYLNWDLTDLPSGDGQLTETATRLQELRAHCQTLGGSLVVEECPRPLKDHLDVWGDVGAALSIMRRLKESLDPRSIMNPGRFVGGI